MTVAFQRKSTSSTLLIDATENWLRDRDRHQGILLEMPYGNSQSIVSKTESENALLGVLAANGFRVTSTKQLARLHDDDKYEAEMIVISEVLAYFEISSKRLIDIMPMIFETVFAIGFVDDLRKNLTRLSLVGVYGLDNCTKYGVYEPDVQVRRADLNWQKQILSDALALLFKPQYMFSS